MFIFSVCELLMALIASCTYPKETTVAMIDTHQTRQQLKTVLSGQSKENKNHEVERE